MVSKLKLALSLGGIGTVLAGGTALALWYPEQNEDEVTQEEKSEDNNNDAEEKKRNTVELIENPERKSELSTQIARKRRHLDSLNGEFENFCERNYWAGAYQQCVKLSREIESTEKELKDLSSEIAKFK